MEPLSGELRGQIDAIGADHQAGASRLLVCAIAVLGAARAVSEGALRSAARELVRLQPTLAPILNAAAIAVADPSGKASAAFARRVEAAPRAMVSNFVRLVGAAGSVPHGPVHITTFSCSASVSACLRALGGRFPLAVTCGEGRPVLEGRVMTAELARSGISVELVTDAGLSDVLSRSDAVVVGADAITSAFVINKVGTGMLAALANAIGRPVYVVATRDKFLPAVLEPLLRVEEQPGSEVWDSAPPGVTVGNRYFEAVPIGWVSALVTDAGVIGPDDAIEVCRANGRLIDPAVTELLRSETAGS